MSTGACDSSVCGDEAPLRHKKSHSLARGLIGTFSSLHQLNAYRSGAEPQLDQGVSLILHQALAVKPPALLRIFFFFVSLLFLSPMAPTGCQVFQNP